MVVEDEAATADVVATALVDEGYRVVTARDGQDALRVVQRTPPDAILLDLRLPILDGWQVVRRCRADPVTSDIPIIVVSAAYDAQQDADIERLVFVEKPFDLDVLLVLVEDAVSSSAAYATA
jgi:CheY-like chemotaxis protein